MAYEFIKTENKDGVFVVTMHDPPTRNSLGPQMADELMECLDNFEDDPSARVLMNTWGIGHPDMRLSIRKHFCPIDQIGFR